MSDELLFKELITKIDQIKPKYPAWLSVKQCGQYLGLSESTIRKLVSTGQIPYKRLPLAESGAIRFNRRLIDFWLLTGELKPKARARQTFEALLD